MTNEQAADWLVTLLIVAFAISLIVAFILCIVGLSEGWAGRDARATFHLVCALGLYEVAVKPLWKLLSTTELKRG